MTDSSTDSRTDVQTDMDVASQNSPSINDEHFEEMRDLLDEDFNGLILAYIQESQQRVLDLQQAQANNDNETGYDLAHYLKGTSANLGLPKLNKLCYVMQEACRDKKIAQTEQLVAQIAQEVAKSNTEIKSRLNKQ